MKIATYLFKLVIMLFLASAFSFALGAPPIVGIGIVALGQIYHPPVAAALMAFDFSDLPDPAADNMGGFTVTAYLGFTDEIDSEPALPSSPSTAEEEVTLQGSYTMLDTNHFIKVYTTPRTLQLIAENQGEIDGYSFRPNGQFLHPSTGAAARAFAKHVKNKKGVLILIDPNTGERIVVGTKKLPVFLKPSVDFGQAPADQRGLTVEFEADSPVPGYNYNGAIPLDSGQVDPIS